MTEPDLHTFQGWTFRLRPAHTSPARLLLLLHGWQGDENSMGILARNMPDRYTLLAPRAPLVAPEGGYTWREVRPGTWAEPTLEEMAPAVEGLIRLVEAWSADAGIDARLFDLMGFSQGALLAYSIALLHPGRVARLAALSGFLPEGAEQALAAAGLQGKHFFVAHGRRDDMVPVERARQAVTLLEKAGGRITYCESDAAHKVSKECLRAMEEYFRAD